MEMFHMKLQPRLSEQDAANCSCRAVWMSAHDQNTGIDLLKEPVTLSNGVVIPNRLVKVAMEEGIGWGYLPTKDHETLYKTWGEGGWGAVITGNVQVDTHQLATMHDMVITHNIPIVIRTYTSLYKSLQSNHNPQARPKGLVQLSHPGLQSHILTLNSPFTQSISSIASRPSLGASLYARLLSLILYPRRARRLDKAEWHNIVAKFVVAAMAMRAAGWDGVQIHAAHGYLLAAYLTSCVPPSIPLRLHLLHLILHSINNQVDPDCIISLKLNCSDFVHGGLDEVQATHYIHEIISWRIVHILEISGGTYSTPAFADPSYLLSSNSSSKRQAMFAHFTRNLRSSISASREAPMVLLTGGLSSRDLMGDALRSDACDLVGIGRAACLDPHFAKTILNPSIQDEDARLEYHIPNASSAVRFFSLGGQRKTSRSSIPLIGAGVSTMWHEWQLARIGRGVGPDGDMEWSVRTVLKEGLGFGVVRWVVKWYIDAFFAAFWCLIALCHLACQGRYRWQGG